MKRLIVAAALILAACGDGQAHAQAPPSWFVLRDSTSLYADALRDLWQTPVARVLADATAPRPGVPPFVLHFGDRPLFDELGQGEPWGSNTAGVTVLSRDAVVNMAGVVIDVGRLLAVADGDSAVARVLVRDALLHELAHVLPVARARSASARLVDPLPGEADPPILRVENSLRARAGLPLRDTYALTK